ncbi:MAG: hypothetical protein ACO331_02605 [Prochlorothrix sp.]
MSTPENAVSENAVVDYQTALLYWGKLQQAVQTAFDRVQTAFTHEMLEELENLQLDALDEAGLLQWEVLESGDRVLTVKLLQPGQTWIEGQLRLAIHLSFQATEPVDLPESDALGEGLPDAAMPDAIGPDAIVLDAEVPDAIGPDDLMPDAEVPDVAMPDAIVLDAEVPDAEVPDTTMPDAIGTAITVLDQAAVERGAQAAAAGDRIGPGAAAVQLVGIAEDRLEQGDGDAALNGLGGTPGEMEPPTAAVALEAVELSPGAEPRRAEVVAGATLAKPDPKTGPRGAVPDDSPASDDPDLEPQRISFLDNGVLDNGVLDNGAVDAEEPSITVTQVMELVVQQRERNRSAFPQPNQGSKSVETSLIKLQQEYRARTRLPNPHVSDA